MQICRRRVIRQIESIVCQLLIGVDLGNFFCTLHNMAMKDRKRTKRKCPKNYGFIKLFFIYHPKARLQHNIMYFSDGKESTKWIASCFIKGQNICRHPSSIYFYWFCVNTNQNLQWPRQISNPVKIRAKMRNAVKNIINLLPSINIQFNRFESFATVCSVSVFLSVIRFYFPCSHFSFHSFCHSSSVHIISRRCTK